MTRASERGTNPITQSRRERRYATIRLGDEARCRREVQEQQTRLESDRVNIAGFLDSVSRGALGFSGLRGGGRFSHAFVHNCPDDCAADRVLSRILGIVTLGGVNDDASVNLATANPG